MLNRILTVLCLFILTAYAIATDGNWVETIKKDLREHNDYIAQNEEPVIKKRLETIVPNRLADWKRSAELGMPEGQVLLGICYHYGVGVLENKEEAIKWYYKAAQQGNVDGQDRLAANYYDGEGVPENKMEAVKWWHKAAEQGLAMSQCSLGACYANGIGVPEDEAKVEKWLRKAAEQGYVLSQCNLGL
jgi:TPR repeat protein